jgi:hypothetical protein
MKHKKLFAIPVLALAVFALFAAAFADDKGDKLGPYKLLTTITLPGGLAGFDISWADSESGRYYLADRGNATATPPVPPRIDVIDTERDTYLTSITGFTGPNGVVAIRKGDDGHGQAEGADSELWVGDADSTAKVVDLHSNSIVATIPTRGTKRADELAYDPVDRLILIANDQDNPPFITFISTTTLTVVGSLSYPQAVFGSPVTNHGIEQSVWDGRTGKFYISIPATSSNPKGEVDEISPSTMMVTRIVPTTCNPAGLALIPGQHLMTSCGDVVDIASGKVMTTVAGVGGDEIWYNHGDGRVYFGGGTNFISVNVVDATTYSVITTLTVGVIVPPVPPAFFNPASQITHSVAADSMNNHIFVPVSNVGIKVYTDDVNGEGHGD